jgi:peptidoglycan hydrolase-like protein with peptidoglycan-binding domain
VSRSGWFRRQHSVLGSSGAGAARWSWRRTREIAQAAARAGEAAGARPGLRRRGAALTAGSAALVLAAGVFIVTFAAPGSHAAPVLPVQGSPAAQGQPLQLVSITPSAGARGVNGSGPIWVQFSAPLAAGTPLPKLSPQIPGSWQVQGDLAVFIPATGWFEDTKVTVTVPGGPGGMTSATGTGGPGGTLSSSVTETFTTGSFGTLRLQQLLAQLGYLPMTWTPKSHSVISPTNAHAELAAAYSAPAGTFSWNGDWPWNLKSQWKAGSPNILDVGAVRAFESVQGLTMDGVAGKTVWSKLLSAVAKGKHNPNGYSYGLADQDIPESFTLWHNGRVVLHSPANTGISLSPTVDGTFPVYLRFYFTYMKGNNPDGTPYDDPVWYVSYFNGGDAVHYFPRGSYGWNQSLGCVELPWDQAADAYPYLTYGSLVTVIGPVGG